MSAAHILVVDDDRDTRELYRLVFQMGGYRVSETGSVRDGLRLAETTRPDVILTDWLLADGDAFELCETLHRHGPTRRIPIVAATGLSLPPESVARARTLGCREILTKPVDMEALVACATRAMGTVHARRLRAAVVRVERFVARVRGTGAPLPIPEGDRIASLMIAHESRHARPGVALIVADDRGHYVAANAGATSLTGYETQELTRLSVWDLTPMPHSADALALWTRFIQTGNQEGQYEVRRRDGECVQTQYVAIANIAPGLHLSALSAAVSSPLPAVP